MEIIIESLVEGARRAMGTVVVIDVFRAFTTAAVAFARGAKAIVLTADPETALALRAAGIGELCMGEVGGKRPAGFDFGNSPYELSQVSLQGKTLIQSTRAGTVGVCAVTSTDALYAASLLTAAATAKMVRAAAPPVVTLVAMGSQGQQRTDEDEQCALYLRNLLLGHQPDRKAVRKLVLAGAEAAKFDDPEQLHFHPQDRELALAIDSADFAIEVKKRAGLLVAEPCRPAAPP
ncbi:MAG: 2-phosphosulfolactate phosphatase [Gammaproteobacteria bacterium]